MVWLPRLATALFMVSVPVALVLTNVRVVAGEPRIYAYSFSRYDAVGATGIAREELDRAAREIIDYFNSDNQWLDIRVSKDGQSEPLFSEREVLHMRDVKVLFERVYRIQTAAILYSLAYPALVIVWSRERSPQRLARQLRTVGLGTIALVICAGIAISLGFDRLFEQFHLLSFSNDFWLLDPRRDHLVQMFPQGFWFDVTVFIALLTLLEAATLSLLASLYLLRGRPLRQTGAVVPPEVRASGA